MKKSKEMDNMIQEFYAANTSAKSFKKTADELNAKIKEVMRKAFQKSAEDNSYEIGEYVATFSIQDRSEMNEDALLEYLKTHVSKEQLKKTKLIKKREYIDSSVLESLIYNEQLPKEVIEGMDVCRIPKPVEVLKVSKKKVKKGE